jgi:hypothetical protein
MAQPSRSAFDFSDRYGTDPVMRRYRPVDFMDIREAQSAARSSAASRELAEANLATAQAELNAKLAPMKMASEAIKTMSDMIKTKTALEEDAAVQRSAAAISEGLGKAGDLDAVISLGNSNLLGLKDSVVGPQWRNSTLNAFRQATDNAQSADEVDRAYARLPASVAFEPEFKGLYDNAKNQAVLRQTVREKFAAEPSLGAVPTTTTGGVDVTAAGLAIAAKGGELARRDVAIENAKLLQKQVGDLQDKLKQDEALGITPSQSDKDLLETYQRQFEINLKQAGILPTATAVPAAQPAPATAAPTPIKEDVVGSLLPPEAREATKVPAVAAASAAATGEPAAATTPISTTPTKPTAPVSLEEEAALFAEQAAPKTKPAEGRAAMAMEAKRKRDEQDRSKILKDERTRLQSAIFQKKGRGGGGKITTNLKPGLNMEDDVIKRTLARINEITAEIGE